MRKRILRVNRLGSATRLTLGYPGVEVEIDYSGKLLPRFIPIIIPPKPKDKDDKKDDGCTLF